MPDTKQSIILGALVTGVLSTSYLGLINFLCCMGVLVGALVAVWHYTETNELTIPTGKGASMGAMAALGGLLMATVLNLILISVGINHELVLQEYMLNNFYDSLPPEQIEAIEAEMEAGKTLVQHFLGLLIGGATFSVFGAIGGSIGAKVFKKGGDEPTDLSVIEEL